NFEARFFSSDYLPPETSITHEGLYAEYFFETGSEKEKLFSCNWNYALSSDPISSSPVFYLCCCMNSCLDGDGLRKVGRPPLNLIVGLDISGSMSSIFRGEGGAGDKSLINVA